MEIIIGLTTVIGLIVLLVAMTFMFIESAKQVEKVKLTLTGPLLIIFGIALIISGSLEMAALITLIVAVWTMLIVVSRDGE